MIAASGRNADASRKQTTLVSTLADAGRLGLSGLFERLTRAGRRLGMAAYHGVAAINYDRRLLARRRSTPAGPYYSYEPVATHASDPLLAALAAAAGPTETIYDLGAYAGAYALPLSGHPDRTVVAVEPDPDSRRRLRANAERTAPEGELFVVPAGIGAEAGRRPFYRSSFPKLSSFEEADAIRWGARLRAVESVPVVTLDELATKYPAPDQVKIDVEGLAPAVLAGGTETIAAHRPTLYVEPHDRPGADRTAAIRRWCRDHDYEVLARERALICRPLDR